MKRSFSGLPSGFLKLWIGQTVSEFGSRITRAGIPLIAVITLTASPSQMAVLAAVGSIPVLLFGLFAGVWVDRLRRRPILIVADLLRAGLLLTLPLAALTGHLTMVLLYGLTAVLGTLALTFETAYRAYLPALVARDQIVAANSRLSTSEALAEVGGPAVAGLLIQIISAPLAVIFDALTFLFSAISLSLIRQPEAPPAQHSDEASVRREIADGIRVIAHSPVLRTLAISLALRSFFGNFYAVLYDLYGIQVLGLTPSILGLLIGAGGVGALIGAALADRWQRRFGVSQLLIGSFLISALIGLLTPLAGGSALLAAIMLAIPQLIGDGAMMIYWINALSLRQMMVPDHLLGRVNASFGFLEMGIAPVGALIAGVLATGLGARLTLLIAVLGIIATAVWISRSPLATVGRDALERVRPEELTQTDT